MTDNPPTIEYNGVTLRVPEGHPMFKRNKDYGRWEFDGFCIQFYSDRPKFSRSMASEAFSYWMLKAIEKYKKSVENNWPSQITDYLDFEYAMEWKTAFGLGE